MGYDSDHPRAEGEVGKVGVAISSIDDMRLLLAGLPLDEVTTSMTINATAATLLLLYELVGEEQGVDRRLAARDDPERHPQGVRRAGHLHLPAAALDAARDRHVRLLPRAPPELEHDLDLGLPHPRGGLDGGPGGRLHPRRRDRLREAALDAGLEVDEFAPRLSFFFNAHNNLFEEVASFRAARRMWARIMTERFGARDPRSTMLRFHTQTGGLDPHRPAAGEQRRARHHPGARGGARGTQSLHTNGFDEALGLPTERAAQLALRTQQIIGFESGVGTRSTRSAGRTTSRR